MVIANQDNMHLLQRLTDMEGKINTSSAFLADKNRDIEDLKAQLQIQVQKQCKVEIDDVKLKALNAEANAKVEAMKEKVAEDKNKHEYEMSLLQRQIDTGVEAARETKNE